MTPYDNIYDWFPPFGNWGYWCTACGLWVNKADLRAHAQGSHGYPLDGYE